MTIVGLLLGYSAYCADASVNSKDVEALAIGEKGFALGAYYDKKANDVLPYFQGFYKWFEAGIGANWVGEKWLGVGDWEGESYLSGFAGFRYNIAPQLYVTAGASGYYKWVAFSKEYNSYLLGAYVGLQYFMAPHFMVNIQAMPYDYERRDNNTREHEVFKQGMIGVSYIF